MPHSIQHFSEKYWIFCGQIITPGVMSLALSFLSKHKPRIPRAFLWRLKDAVLGRRYSLSVVFTDSAQMRRLNRAYRHKDKATDILSFPLSKTEGEIFVAPSVARREAKKFNRLPQNFLLFLLIHGMLHLKGLRHGEKMESAERLWRKKFRV